MTLNSINVNNVIRNQRLVATYAEQLKPNIDVESVRVNNNASLQNVRKDSVEIDSDYSFNLKRSKDYNLIGARSKMDDIDVEKAVSNIKKDSRLEQYKFFVKTDILNNEDGSVRRVIR